MAARATAVPTAVPLLRGKVATRTGPEPLIRERLLTELERFSSAALTLVDAPVGFGKTVLVQTWAARTDAAVAWVSLDDADNDPLRLWTGVARSIEGIRSGLGRRAIARLQAPRASTDRVVDEVVAALTAYAAPLALVLDDLHLVTDENCLRSLERALVGLPSNARVIATTRSDPRLPLARLRAGGALGEIRMRELAFTLDEARALLVGRERIALDDEHVALLVERTEGWPAGLYLAALWLRELDDPEAGVESFHGDHRHVADYLTDEVLDALDRETRRFLLETAVLGRFSGRMCDAVLGRTDSVRRLRELERTNGFLIALDPQGEWYRYHQLFRELLQLELATLDPLAPRRLHRAAARWCRGEGLIEDALEHAAGAEDLELLASTLAQTHLGLMGSGRFASVLRWCAALPEGKLLDHPELPISATLAAGLSGKPADVRHRYAALAERSRSERAEQWAPYHEAAFGIARSTWVERDLGDSIEIARRAADIARAFPELAVASLANLGFLLYLSGDPAGARDCVREALYRPDATRHTQGFVHALATLSLLASESGSSDEADERAHEALAVARAAGVDESAAGGAAGVALATALEREGRLREAEREAVRGERWRRQHEPELVHMHALLVLASIRMQRGELARVDRHLDRVRRGLDAFTDAGGLPALLSALDEQRSQAGTLTAALSDAPSAAELSVLRLLPTALSQREIGGRLYLSLNTVKTHTRALYRKLGVSSREGAVRRGVVLGLLEEDDSPG